MRTLALVFAALDGDPDDAAPAAAGEWARCALEADPTVGLCPAPVPVVLTA